jgi:hypothetical protein
VLGWLRRRKLGETGRRRLLIALAHAEEELIETHVANAIGVIEAMGDDLPVNRALEIYFEAFDPGEPRSAIVARRVLARFEADGNGASRGRRGRRS